MRFAIKYRLLSNSYILHDDCLQRMQIQRSRVERVISFHLSLDEPNQFLAYVCLRFGSFASLDENGNIIAFFGFKG